MNFRDFLNLAEQGTQFSTTGFNAGGRAGQSQATPEMGVTRMPTPNPVQMNPVAGPKTIARSSFNVSDQGKGLTPRGFGPLNAGGIKTITNPPASPMSPRGLGTPQPIKPMTGPNVQSPKPKL